MSYESDEMMKLIDYLDNIRKENDLCSVWSVAGCDSIESAHPFTHCKTVVYRDHWGDKEVSARIEGTSYLDVWKACDKCIRESGDRHHVFIEGFRCRGDTVVLITGS